MDAMKAGAIYCVWAEATRGVFAWHLPHNERLICLKDKNIGAGSERPGCGSTFSLSLPVSAGPPPACSSPWLNYLKINWLMSICEQHFKTRPPHTPCLNALIIRRDLNSGQNHGGKRERLNLSFLVDSEQLQRFNGQIINWPQLYMQKVFVNNGETLYETVQERDFLWNMSFKEEIIEIRYFVNKNINLTGE